MASLTTTRIWLTEMIKSDKDIALRNRHNSDRKSGQRCSVNIVNYYRPLLGLES